MAIKLHVNSVAVEIKMRCVFTNQTVLTVSTLPLSLQHTLGGTGGVKTEENVKPS